MNLEEIKIYLELAIMTLVAITSLILMIRALKTKLDKNKNGKIETEELTDADIQFIKEMLKESLKTIATGMININGLSSEKAYSILLKETKTNKKIFEEIEKEKEKKENENNKN